MIFDFIPKIVHIGVLVIGGVIAALLVIEIFVRVFLVDSLPIYVFNTDVNRRLRENISTKRFNEESGVEVKIESNRWGLRDENWQLDGTDTRILVIGDSMVEAVQVEEEDRFTELTESYLQRLGFKVTVGNCGVSGSGPQNYTRLLEYCGEKFQPDINIIAFFSNNDFSDSSALWGGGNRYNYTITNGSVVKYPETVTAIQKIQWMIRGLLYKNSNAAVMIYDSLSKVANRPDGRGKVSNSCGAYTDKNHPRMVEAIQITEYHLRQMSSLSSKPLLLIDIPAKGAVLNEKDCEWEFPETWLANLGDVMGFEFLPILVSMRGSDESLYWGHLTPDGHRLVANLLGDRLAEMLLNMAEE